MSGRSRELDHVRARGKVISDRGTRGGGIEDSEHRRGDWAPAVGSALATRTLLLERRGRPRRSGGQLW